MYVFTLYQNLKYMQVQFLTLSQTLRHVYQVINKTKEIKNGQEPLKIDHCLSLCKNTQGKDLSFNKKTFSILQKTKNTCNQRYVNILNLIF